MKGKWILLFGGVAVLFLLTLAVGLSQAQGPQPPEDVRVQAALGTAFTYQGQLKQGGNPVNGTCDCDFSLWDAASGGTQIGLTQAKTGVNVVNGLFTISGLDFGSGVFNGEARWLAIAVRCPAGSGSYTNLSPRQPLTAVPYALSLRPGALISGTAYQSLKVMSYAPAGGIPAGITGEIYAAKDGVGVHGANYVSSADATGMGVWGRTWSPKGWAVVGNGYNGATGVMGGSDSGTGVYGTSQQGYAGYFLAPSVAAGVMITGTAYQNLKVMSYAPTGGIPAGVTGEMNVAKDGVGVYGSNVVSSADATGIGVWGRTWSPRGYGVAGSAYNGAAGVYGHSWSDNGIGVYASAPITGVYSIVTDSTYGRGVFGSSPYVGVWGESTSTYAAGVQGWNVNGAGVSGYGGTWGVYGKTHTGTAIYAQVTNSSGTLMRGYTGALGGHVVFRLDSTGRGFFNGGYETGGADVAEFISVIGDPQPGDVVEIDRNHPGQFRLASTPNSTAVAGVISTKPGASLGAVDPASVENTGPQLALVGNVPVKVSAENGAIHPGDLLVASSTPGHAMRAPVNPAPGTVIGKALGSLESGTGIIQMLAMLR